jgi:hypothetical protein
MRHETGEAPEETPSGPPTTDWADLRAQAAKLGITLSQLQQQQRQRELRLKNKAQPRATQKRDDVSE